MVDLSAPGTSSESRFPRGEAVVLRLLAIAGLLYLFILSITLLGASFKLFGKEFAEAIFHATSNPVAGLMIGLLATAIIQSSSTTTSIVVGLVASGMLTIENAIPMVMGANIGTTITNIIVSLGHISRKDEFRKALEGATVHDFFNLCSVVVLLPLQIEFNNIGRGAVFMETLFEGFGGLKFSSPLAVVTKPVSHWLIEIFQQNPYVAGIFALLLLFIALRYIVKVLKSLVLERVEKFFQKYIFRTPALSFILGMLITVLVQSSSITTSIVVPLIGAGVLTIQQIYPYFLGANVGTTITAFLASFVTGSPAAVTVAFSHLLFNIYGILIFWPLQRIPMWMSRQLSRAADISRALPFVYLGAVYFLIPGIIFYFMER